jgi:methylphosphotriester-DNA--protein-cysteine methyltransferase
MLFHGAIGASRLKQAIRDGFVVLGGNRKLKIYGRLYCWSGRRMKLQNRVFFSSEIEAIEQGYRPCGLCMKKEFASWKRSGG